MVPRTTTSLPASAAGPAGSASSRPRSTRRWPARSRAASVDAAAAVDEDRLARDEAAVVGGQEDERPDEILGDLGPLQHPRLDVRQLPLLRNVLLVLAAQGEARRDRVDADAELSQLARERAREPHHAALGGGVVDVVRDALEEGTRGDVDDRAPALRLHRREHRARAE